MEALEISFYSKIRARPHGFWRMRSFIAEQVLCVSNKLPQQVAACYLQHEQLQQHGQVSLSATTKAEKKVESDLAEDAVCISHMYLAEKEIEET